jgi:hypothetical protein
MKLNKKLLDQVVMKRLQEKFTKKEETITVKELNNLIEQVINEKLKGEAFDTVKELEDSLKSALIKLTKTSVQSWVKDVERLRQKGDGYQCEVIGSGNVKISIKWQKTPQKNMLFELSCSEPFIVGDPYKENAYKFMVALALKKEKVSEILSEVVKSLGSLGEESEDDTEETSSAASSTPIETNNQPVQNKPAPAPANKTSVPPLPTK